MPDFGLGLLISEITANANSSRALSVICPTSSKYHLTEQEIGKHFYFFYPFPLPASANAPPADNYQREQSKYFAQFTTSTASCSLTYHKTRILSKWRISWPLSPLEMRSIRWRVCCEEARNSRSSYVSYWNGVKRRRSSLEAVSSICVVKILVSDMAIYYFEVQYG